MGQVSGKESSIDKYILFHILCCTYGYGIPFTVLRAINPAECNITYIACTACTQSEVVRTVVRCHYNHVNFSHLNLLSNIWGRFDCQNRQENNILIFHLGLYRIIYTAHEHTYLVTAPSPRLLGRPTVWRRGGVCECTIPVVIDCHSSNIIARRSLVARAKGGLSNYVTSIAVGPAHLWYHVRTVRLHLTLDYLTLDYL